MKIDVNAESTGPQRHEETREDSRTIEVNFKETATDVRLTMEIGGVEAKDLDVTLQGQKLTIAWERNVTSVSEEGGMRRTEKRVENRKRELDLPCEVLPEKIDAVLKDGVLKLTLAKKDTGGAVKVGVRQE